MLLHRSCLNKQKPNNNASYNELMLINTDNSVYSELQGCIIPGCLRYEVVRSLDHRHRKQTHSAD